ncbi:hypothetical protein [Clavibacter michiganensis]|uniref:hypothetical protein n=1 Tax=Clavibacter michiganensis TaxID=28447 RepID=UPI0015E201C7|nr:hypothetical protein [Clavibacter michiganensis]
MSAHSRPFDITHHPAIRVPCGTVGGMPVGILLIDAHFDEATLFRGGRPVEYL